MGDLKLFQTHPIRRFALENRSPTIDQFLLVPNDHKRISPRMFNNVWSGLVLVLAEWVIVKR